MPDYSAMARVLAPALSVFFHDYAGTRDLGRGTAFPTTDVLGGLQAGDRFFRTDLGFVCYFDGTRWLTVTEYACVLSTSEAQAASFAATTVNVRNGQLRQDYTVRLTRGECTLFIGATNSGASFVTYAFKNNGATATYWTFNTSAIGANQDVSFTINEASFTQPTGAIAYVRLDMTVTGAPSAQYPRAPVIWYRLIIP